MLSKEKIKQMRKLHDKKWRTESGLFLVEGRKMILELLASDWKEHIEELYVSEKLFEEIQKWVITDTETISKISTLENNSDGVAVMKQKQLLSLPKGQNLRVSYTAWTLVLDGIRDPGNMGTILRTASWFGVKNIVCSQDSVELYNPKVVSATMWALFHLQISSQNLEDFYEKNTLPVYAAELWGTNIGEIAFPISGVLVMGSESHGISELSRKYMTQGILIPKIGYGESLNVGIATGILLSHIVK